MADDISRRTTLAMGIAGSAMLVHAVPVLASPAEEALADFIGTATVGNGGIELDMPEIAENGYSVSIEVRVDSAMEGDDAVEEIFVVADANPSPAVGKFRFSALSGEARVATRIRLARSQNVTALARMKDGSVRRTVRAVDVVLGGCGG